MDFFNQVLDQSLIVQYQSCTTVHHVSVLDVHS
jgi:hypothetical protein